MTDKKSNGHGNHDDDEDDKVVHMPTLAERDRMRKQAEKEARRSLSKGEPVINLPPATKYMLAIFVSIHLVNVFVLTQAQQEWIFMHLGFIPGRFTGAAPFEMLTLITPVTHMLIHGSWLHIGMNGVMMMAFGSGIERWMGSRRMIIFFILCGLLGALTHFALNAFSVYPVVGASGGLSGLFAAALLMINRGQQELGGRFGLLPFVILWIGVSIAFGMMGSPDGHSVAWAAHVGGFLGGFLVLKLMRV